MRSAVGSAVGVITGAGRAVGVTITCGVSPTRTSVDRGRRGRAGAGVRVGTGVRGRVCGRAGVRLEVCARVAVRRDAGPCAAVRRDERTCPGVRRGVGASVAVGRCALEDGAACRHGSTPSAAPPRSATSTTMRIANGTPTRTRAAARGCPRHPLCALNLLRTRGAADTRAPQPAPWRARVIPNASGTLTRARWPSSPPSPCATAPPRSSSSAECTRATPCGRSSTAPACRGCRSAVSRDRSTPRRPDCSVQD